MFNGWWFGKLIIRFATFNRWNDKRNVNVNENDNDWNAFWWFAGLRKSLYFPMRWYALSHGVLFCRLIVPTT